MRFHLSVFQLVSSCLNFLFSLLLLYCIILCRNPLQSLSHLTQLHLIQLLLLLSRTNLLRQLMHHKAVFCSVFQFFMVEINYFVRLLLQSLLGSEKLGFYLLNFTVIGRSQG